MMKSHDLKHIAFHNVTLLLHMVLKRILHRHGTDMVNGVLGGDREKSDIWRLPLLRGSIRY